MGYAKEDQHGDHEEEKKMDDGEFDKLLRLIREKLERNLGMNSAGAVKAAFAEIDTDHSGTLDRSEWDRAMTVLKIDLSRSEISRLFKRFDTAGSGEIDCEC